MKSYILKRHKWICGSNPSCSLTHLNPRVVGLIGLMTVVLSVFASVFEYFPGDIAVSNWVQSLKTPWLDTIMELISIFGDTIPQFIISVAISGIIFLRIGRLESVILGGGIGAAFILNKILKFVIDRPRPDFSLVEVATNLSSASFPSGHVMHMTVLLGVLTLLVQKKVNNKYLRIGLILLFLNLWGFTALSRIYLGLHWPSDVLGGFCWGITALYLVFLVYKKTIHGRNESNVSLLDITKRNE